MSSINFELCLLETILLRFSVSTHVSSKNCISAANNHKYVYRNKASRRTWMAFRPLDIWFGTLFVVKNREFILELFGVIIMQIVINMILIT